MITNTMFTILLILTLGLRYSSKRDTLHFIFGDKKRKGGGAMTYLGEGLPGGLEGWRKLCI